MTYDSDPTRWTQSPGDAPESLRAVFDAGRREAPSDRQMHNLSLRLAALSCGAAVAASAASAQASTSLGGASLGGASMGGTAVGGGLSLAKIAAAVVLIGAAATGTVLLRRGEAPRVEGLPDPQVETADEPIKPVEEEREPDVSEPTRQAPRVSRARTPAVPTTAPRQAERRAEASEEVEERDQPRDQEDAAGDEPRPRSTRERRIARAEARSRGTPRTGAVESSARPSARADEPSAPASGATHDAAQASEIELLRKARAALSARPREAFRLTEQHRSEYPQGVFTQERDALAVEALLRSGELKLARELAEAFVRRYPSSPHAHRFRETMNLQ